MPNRTPQVTVTPGAGVDKAGNPVVDPTQNVIALVEAGSKRHDDLLAAFERFTRAEIIHVKEISTLHASYGEKLATQAGASAETLRVSMGQMVRGLTERVSLLEQFSNMGKGKEAVSDPIMERMVLELKVLSTAMEKKQGSGEGMEKMYGWLVAGATAILGTGGVAGFLMAHFAK